MKLAPVPRIVQPHLLLLVPELIRLQFRTGPLQHPRTVASFPSRPVQGRMLGRHRAFTPRNRMSVRQREVRFLPHRWNRDRIHLSQTHEKRPQSRQGAHRIRVDRQQEISRTETLLFAVPGRERALAYTIQGLTGSVDSPQSLGTSLRMTRHLPCPSSAVRVRVAEVPDSSSWTWTDLHDVSASYSG
jgi:hypothetical protein